MLWLFCLLAIAALDAITPKYAQKLLNSAISYGNREKTALADYYKVGPLLMTALFMQFTYGQ